MAQLTVVKVWNRYLFKFFFAEFAALLRHKTAAESPGSKIFTYVSKWNELAYARPITLMCNLVLYEWVIPNWPQKYGEFSMNDFFINCFDCDLCLWLARTPIIDYFLGRIKTKTIINSFVTIIQVNCKSKNSPRNMWHDSYALLFCTAAVNHKLSNYNFRTLILLWSFLHITRN